MCSVWNQSVNICWHDDCLVHETLSSKINITHLRRIQGEVKVRSRRGQGKVKGKVRARSRKGQGNVNARKIKVKVRSMRDQGNIKRGSRQGQSKVKERLRAKIRSKQCKHSLNRNYNVMGFDTIEINLVWETLMPWLGVAMWLKLNTLTSINVFLN